MGSYRVLKTISIVSFALITLAIALAYNSQATGYEASIYESTPVFVWIALTLSTLCGVYVTVSSLYNRGCKSRFPILGLSIAAFSAVVVVLVFALRGYLLNITGDVGNHLYSVSYLLTWGHAGSRNYYPLMHYYMATLHNFTGIALLDIFDYLPAFFNAFFMASVYLLAKTVVARNEQAILAALAGIPLLVTSPFMTPFAVLVWFFPFIAYIVFHSAGRSKNSCTLLAIILTVFSAILHPLGAITLLALLLGVWLFQRFKTPFHGSDRTLKRLTASRSLALLFVALLFGWLSRTYILTHTLQKVLGRYRTIPYISSYADLAAAAQGFGYNIYELILKLYGGTALYIALSTVAFVLVWKRLSQGEDLLKLKGLFGGYVLIIAVYVPLFFAQIVSPFRVLCFILTLSAVFVGFVLYEFKQRLMFKKNGKAINIVVTCALIVAVSVNGMLILYPSTLTRSPTLQTTNAEVSGNLWFLEKTVPQVDFKGLTGGVVFTPWRFLWLLPDKPQNGSSARSDLMYYPDQFYVKEVPPHLGYDNYTKMGQTVWKDTYVAFSEQSKRVYVDVYPEIASKRILPEDFSRMENDTTLNKVFSNGGFDTWYLTPQP